MSADHPITITPIADRVSIKWGGRTIVETSKALELKEHVYSPVLYVPREDADLSVFERTARETVCPYKGVANYYSLGADANVVWTYEHPKAGVEAIAGHLAFYPDKVEISRKAG